MVAKVESVEKVTTVLGTTDPLESINVAVTTPGVLPDIEVMVEPLELVSESVSVADAVVVVVLEEDVEPEDEEPTLQPERNAAEATIKANKLTCFNIAVRKAAPINNVFVQL
ncbi:MAG: hypothetical protein PHQ60_12095 [Sideroxydans sp.]|nr:hypothetical protein [Sideroxydans sp.]